ncbi:hypothetical protein GQ55_3G321500 [Panicum hallii var. hallii]|uniref:Uncharacterized protein n=2 Tax=Panicum hallii TaxID=206008 RepID=A0A2T7EFD7_9POAL|nr:hypothetical protein GQ55_3G321500 [Panicum hallii var. hallii]PVH62597.1 hypothetical protein PAHAL_3G333000 [Panicum hallii]
MVEKQGTCITIQCRHYSGRSMLLLLWAAHQPLWMDAWTWIHGWMVLHVPIFSTEHKLSQHASARQVHDKPHRSEAVQAVPLISHQRF